MKKFRVGQKVRCIDERIDTLNKEFVVRAFSDSEPCYGSFYGAESIWCRSAEFYELVSLLTEEQWDEFLAGKLSIPEGELMYEFLQECEDMNILWCSGAKATKSYPYRSDFVYIRDGRLTTWIALRTEKILILTKEENKMDNTCAKEFTTKDLVTGDRAVIADGRNLLVIKSKINDKFTLYDDDTLYTVADEDLYLLDFKAIHDGNKYDIKSIYSADGKLKWECIEEIEMTMEEINKAIGKKVKVVEKKEQ